MLLTASRVGFFLAPSFLSAIQKRKKKEKEKRAQCENPEWLVFLVFVTLFLGVANEEEKCSAIKKVNVVRRELSLSVVEVCLSFSLLCDYYITLGFV